MDQQHSPVRHLDDLQVSTCMVQNRNVWGVAYTIYSFTCLEGELSIYTLSSLFFFLSTFWSIAILLKVKKALVIEYAVHRPWWVSAYISLVESFTSSASARVIFHSLMFIIVMVVPLAIRQHIVATLKH